MVHSQGLDLAMRAVDALEGNKAECGWIEGHGLIRALGQCGAWLGNVGEHE